MQCTRRSTALVSAILLAWCAAALSPAGALAQYGAADGEWRSYGGDAGSTKYSPLDQIDASNFGDLEVAWRWQSADAALDLDGLRERIPRLGIRMFQATPLMAGGVLYLSTALHQVAAVDAGTGETIWVHDPQIYLRGRPTHFNNSRGVAWWSDGDDARIFFGTHEAYLLALDAETGEPVLDWGDDGRVDLMAGIPRADRGGTTRRGRNLMGVASPPVVARDVVVTPNVISDGVIAKEAPPGWIKGVDARTGDVRWVFRTVPQGRRLRHRHVGQRVVALLGQHQRLAADERRRGAGLRVPADGHARPATTTAATGPATTCSRRAWWRSTSRRASACGTSRPCTTASGTTTSPPPPASSTSPSRAGPNPSGRSRR